VPESMLPGMVVLATAATVIASQAVITSAFSITRQAVQLDFLPRVRVLQTSEHEEGQIYVPVVNGILMVAVSLFVVAFGSSEALAGAYGAAVAGTMAITTILGAFIATVEWRWSRFHLGIVFLPLLLVDLCFLFGNLTKIAQGAWVPILLSAILFAIFMIWRSGRQQLRKALAAEAIPIGQIGTLLDGARRVPGTAVFLASSAKTVPTALLRNLEHNHVYHERIVILNLEILRTPRQDRAARAWIEELMPNVHSVRARFGFMETPDVSEALRGARQRGLRIDPASCTYFLGWHLVRALPRPGIAGLKGKVFAYLQRRSAQAAEFFRMPTKRVVVLATDVEI